jgi:hypothetical protein
VKVFLDECIDWRFARDIVGHDMKTALMFLAPHQLSNLTRLHVTN